jgi:hypothetical protein
MSVRVMSTLINEAIAEKVKRLEAERGEPFPQRKQQLVVGRPYRGRRSIRKHFTTDSVLAKHTSREVWAP